MCQRKWFSARISCTAAVESALTPGRTAGDVTARGTVEGRGKRVDIMWFLRKLAEGLIYRFDMALQLTMTIIEGSKLTNRKSQITFLDRLRNSFLFLPVIVLSDV